MAVVIVRTAWAVGTRGIRSAVAPSDALVIAWLVVPVAIVYLRSVLIVASFSARHLIIVVPAAYLLVARAITQLPFRRVTLPVVATTLPALLVLHLVIV